MNLTWEQKLKALEALSLAARGWSVIEPSQTLSHVWFCLPPGGIGGDGVVRSRGYGGQTKEEAVNLAWDALTEAFAAGLHLVVQTKLGERRYVWGEFMWVEVP